MYSKIPSSVLFPLIIALLSLSALVQSASTLDDVDFIAHRLSLITSTNTNRDSTWRSSFFDSPIFRSAQGTSYLARANHHPTPFSQNRTSLIEQSFVPSDLPDSFDSRVEWSKCSSLHEVFDQSACGNCHAVSATFVASARMCIAAQSSRETRLRALGLKHFSNNTWMQNDELSVFVDTPLLSVRDVFNHPNSGECSGGSPSQVFETMVSTGLVTGGHYGDFTLCQSYPFPPCAHHGHGDKGVEPCGRAYIPPSPSRLCDMEASGVYPVPYYKDVRKFSTSFYFSGEDAFMKEIVSNGPIAAIITMYSDWVDYSGGVYEPGPKAQSMGRHAIVILGYGEENGVPYWLCLNSYGRAWGGPMQGTFKIRRGARTAAIESIGSAVLF